MNMDRLPKVRAAVEKMAAYHPPAAGRGGKLRLDFNENTFGASSVVTEFLREAVTSSDLTIYPEYSGYRPILAEFFGVDEAQFVLTNGTDEAIQVLINTFVEPADEVIILTPSYAMYRFYSEVMGAKVVTIPYRESTLAFPLTELLAAINPKTKAILISNPNNPTGSAVSLAGIEQILKAAGSAAVLIDEAYYEFFGQTALPWIDRHPNLFVSRTFSKTYGLASMRVGCLFSNELNVEMMRKAQSPYSVNRLAAMAAAKAVKDQQFVTGYVTEVLAARELAYFELEKLRLKYFPSEANFVLVEFGKLAPIVTDGLRRQGVLVRDRSYEIDGCVRITIGTRDQMRFLFEKLTKLLQEASA
jgi:histidinol-phosphate aminotransferase